MTTSRRIPAWSWIAFAALAIAVAVLGIWGFTVYLDTQGRQESLPTRFYLTAQLFTLESGGVTGDIPWQLEIARFSAPTVAAYALLRLIAELFAGQLDHWRIRRLRGHIVVVGLDDCGQRLCRELVHRGHHVMALVPQADPAKDTALRESGVRTVSGDPTSRSALRASGVHRAKHLVVRAPDDGTAAAVVAQSRELVANSARDQPLTCVGVLADPTLWQLIMSDELQGDAADHCRVDFVDLDGAALLLLLREHPPLINPSGERCTVVVTGAEHVADRLVRLLTPVVRNRIGDQAHTIRILQADRWASMAEVPSAFEEGAGPVCAYVCENDEHEAIRQVACLRAQLPVGSNIVVVRRTADPITRLLDHEGGSRGCSVLTYDLTDALCVPEVLLYGTNELLARALHEQYVAGRGGVGNGAHDSAIGPWEVLPEILKQSSRNEARHIAVKLRTVGRLVGPLLDGQYAEEFTVAETELLAQLEHERWVAERLNDDWHFGQRDATAKTTPYLVPWEELSDSERDVDRFLVRKLPAVLASVGLQVSRRLCEQERQ